MNLTPIGPNQTQLDTGNRRVFFSYSTPVAAIVDGEAYRTAEKHSNTTTRHTNAWLAKQGGQPVTVKPQAWFDALKG